MKHHINFPKYETKHDFNCYRQINYKNSNPNNLLALGVWC